jgi:hypothetical protein
MPSLNNVDADAKMAAATFVRHRLLLKIIVAIFAN